MCAAEECVSEQWGTDYVCVESWHGGSKYQADEFDDEVRVSQKCTDPQRTGPSVSVG